VFVGAKLRARKELCYRLEIAGGYLWSPKRNANGARNPFYEFMREVAPGDRVFSFVDTRIIALGIVTSYCYESPKPAEFGGVGLNWESSGWRVRVNFASLQNKIRPKDHIDLLRGLLPSRYSPLQESGNGIQSVYLTELPPALADVLIDLIGKEASILSESSIESVFQKPMQVENADLEIWEHHIESKIEADTGIPDTERETLIVARRGQGLFKQRVMEIETRCRITGVTNPIHLRTSHCKPWRDSNNEERLDGENGLLLTPTIDHLFDRGFISFEDSGVLIVSPVADAPSLNRMGVATDRSVNVGTFTEGQKQFLDYHRESVLLEARH
jgi:putative restriction endonuclease